MQTKYLLQFVDRLIKWKVKKLIFWELSNKLYIDWYENFILQKNVLEYFACSMFVMLFNPFNMIFPFAGRQKACQLSCVPFPSISG